MPELSLETLSLGWLAVFALVMLFGGLVHGTLGLGFPLVTTPLLSLVLDVRSAILLTLLPTVCVNVVSIVRGGRWEESLGRFWPLALYALAGGVIGAQVLVVSDPRPFKLLLALLVLLYLFVSGVAGLRMPWPRTHFALSMLGFGLLAGFAAGTTNVMVPILIVYALELELSRRTTVQVFNMCFLVGKVSQIAVFSVAGLLGGALLVSTAPLAAVAVASLLAGMAVRERIPTDTYRRIIRYLLGVFAALLIAQFLLDT
ncbi:MAG: sulfite exporter TauE/SafE family protein [Gammaproteobacteria bacterium]|nr:sulfite exporter TauE/SafE family protein [Gammaproteobacteria bacterium]